jgi:hypothetical protein
MRRAARAGNGKTSDRFTQKLLSILPDNWRVRYVDPVQGYWKKEDVVRVEGELISPDGTRHEFFCWETMTSCLKRGVILKYQRTDIGQFEVYPS